MTKNSRKEILLSVVIPCYNESGNIPLILERFSKIDKKKLKKIEVILVNNNSKDNSAEVLGNELKKKEYFFAKTIFQEVPGYGSAIFKGLNGAQGEYLCWTHGDIQTPPEDTIKALEIILKEKQNKKCYIKGKRYGRPLFDVLFTFGMSVIETILFFKPFWDINAQPNLFHKSFLKKMKNPPGDFSFDLYTYYLARKNGYKIIRFSVHFGKRVYGKSAWNDGFKARIKFIKRTLKFSFKLRKKYK